MEVDNMGEISRSVTPQAATEIAGTGSAQNLRGDVSGIQARFVGVELYFDDLNKAREFYFNTLGLEVSDEQAGHHARFDSGAGFVCLERKGAESYPRQAGALLRSK